MSAIFESIHKRFINTNWQFHIHASVLILLIAITYYPTLDAPFIFDDFPNIVTNPAVHPERLQDLLNVFESKYSYRRPFALFTFALNYLSGRLDVYGYHIVNIVIHMLNAILVYAIFYSFPFRTSGNQSHSDERNYRQDLSFWAAALWAMNPIQTQAVTYIVQRMTSLATLFYLAAIFVFIKWRENSFKTHTTWLLISLFFLFGMASKEIIITLPLTLILIDYLFYSRKTTTYHKITIIFMAVFAVIAGYFVLKDKFPGFFTIYGNRNFSPWERVMTEWRVVWHYFSLYFLPLPSRMHLAYDFSISKSLLHPFTTIASLAAMLGSWYIAWHYRFKKQVASFAWFFFFLTLALESTFLNLEIAFAHRLYLSSIFLVFALLAALPVALFKRLTVFFLVLLGLWSFWTITRNDEWSNRQSFWESDLKRGAGKVRSLNNQAAALIDQGEFDKALELINQGLTSKPTVTEKRLLLYNKGSILFFWGKNQEALDIYKTIITEFGNFEETMLFLGKLFIRLQKMEEYYKTVDLLLQSQDKKHHGRILEAHFFADQKQYDAAETKIKEALSEISTSKITSRINLKLELARIYLLNKKYKEAYEIFLQITEEYPHHYIAWQQIHAMLVAGNDIERADIIKNYLKSKGITLQEKK